jgi:hypothetical protein
LLRHPPAKQIGASMQPVPEESTSFERKGPRVPRARWKEVVLLILCVSISLSYSFIARRSAGKQILMVDFGALYYGARCAMHHLDPYEPAVMVRDFKADGGEFAPNTSDKSEDRTVLTCTDNLPTALLLTIPFALLPWGLAQNLWVILMALLLVTAALLVWDLGAGTTPLLWASLAGFMLAESDMLFLGGNVAGISVALCIIAVWCFLKGRYAWAGVVLLAISLVFKPHDAGLVWLYFLLAGGVLRKRALQTLAVTGILAVCATAWMQPVSPHWLEEMHRNLGFLLAHGGASDPGPIGMSANTSAQIIDLQAALSGFRDDPHFYNPLAYLISGALILLWAIAAIGKPASPRKTLLALAAISALTLLPVYHRINDATILLLTLPACALLWNEGGWRRWLALGLTSAGFVLTATMPLAFLGANAPAIRAFANRLPGKLASVVLLQPAPCVLLVLGCFFLWMLLRDQPAAVSEKQQETADAPVAAAANLS